MTSLSLLVGTTLHLHVYFFIDSVHKERELEGWTESRKPPKQPRHRKVRKRQEQRKPRNQDAEQTVYQTMIQDIPVLLKVEGVDGEMLADSRCQKDR